MCSLSQGWVFSSSKVMSFLSVLLWSLSSLCLLSHSVLSSFLLIALFNSFSLFSQRAWLEGSTSPWRCSWSLPASSGTSCPAAPQVSYLWPGGLLFCFRDHLPSFPLSLSSFFRPPSH